MSITTGVAVQGSVSEAGGILDTAARRAFWRFVPFLMACYVFAYLDRVNIGFAKIAMSADVGLSEAAYGLGAGIFFIGYFIFEVPSNIMLERFGARRWICRIMLSWGILSASFAFVESTTTFYLLRFLLGVAEAGFFPGVILFLSQWFPAARRGRIIALFMAAIPLSGLVGSPLSGAIMEFMDGYAGFGGWRWMFVIEAVPAMLLGLASLFVLESRIADASWLDDEERQALSGAVEADRGDVPDTEHGTFALLLDRRILFFAAIYFCCIMGQYGITFWLPTIVAASGAGGVLLTGMFTAIPYALAVVTMIAVGHNSDRTGERRLHCAIPMLTGALLLAATPLVSGNFALAMTMMSVATAAVLTATPLFWTLPTRALAGSAAVVGIAAINSIGNLAGFLSPVVVGWLADRTGDTQAGMYVLAACLFAGAVMVLLPRRDGG